MIRVGMPQMEQIGYATPVIPTYGTAVTRAIETARVSPAIEAIVQRSAGSIVVRGQNYMQAIRPIFGSASSSIMRSGGAGVPTTVASEGSALLGTGSGPDMRTTRWAAALGFDASGRSLVRNGAALVADLGTISADRAALYLNRAGASTTGNSHYRSLAFSPYRLAPARLTELAAA